MVAKWLPILLQYRCIQCDAKFTVLIYNDEGAEGASIAIFPTGRGSFTTPRTPESVAYYLGQVYKCWSVGAVPAAVAMYRVVLDHILFGEGYTKGTLGTKINALDKAIKDGTAPDWAKGLKRCIRFSAQ